MINTFKNETLLIDKIIKNPLDSHLILLNNHLSRYDKAIESLEITSKDIVIDASCGLGYGSYVLAQKAKLVIGLDTNPRYIKFAKEKFKTQNIQFFLYDDFKKSPIKADKIVCIETYEHVDKENIGIFLKMILGFLKNRGDMFLTAPLGKNKPSSYNKYHLNEPSIDLLYNNFTRYFRRLIFEIDYFKNSFGYYTRSCYLILKGYKAI